MITEKHKPGPVHNRDWCLRTGYPARATDAHDLHDQFRWLLNWVGQRQIFSFMGPGPCYDGTVPDYSPYRHINPDYDYGGSPYFSIITKSDNLTGEDLRPHALGGVLIPWRYDAGASVTWQRQSGSPVEIWSSAVKSHSDMDAVSFSSVPTNRIMFGKAPREMGMGTDGFGLQKLSYSKLMVAGLGVWTMPDFSPLCMDEEAFTLIQEAEFALMRQVRGYAGTSKLGIGHLIGYLGELKERTSRCLLQSGHPTGIYTTSTSYVDIRNGRAAGAGQSAFMVQPKGLYRGDDVTCTPAVVAWAPGASEGSPAYVKFTAVSSADTCEIPITSAAQAIYVSAAGLDVYRQKEQVIIEMKAASGGAIALRTYSLWEDD